MSSEIVNMVNPEDVYHHISALIEERKTVLKNTINNTMVSTYWSIGQYLVDEVLHNQKPEYGKQFIVEISKRLSSEYGSGFDKSSVTRMIQFYQEFPDAQIVATLSQQLTWSHFVVLLPIKDENQRNFYATLCRNELWSVRTLRERKKSMLYERTAISKKPEETIYNDLEQLLKPV